MATVNLSAVITPSNVLTDSNTVSGITNKSFTSPAITTSITTASTSFTALAGATTLLTLGGTGASSVLAIPGTLEQSTTTGALTVAGGVYIAKKLNVAGVATLANGAVLGTPASGNLANCTGIPTGSAATATALGTVYANQTTSGGTPYLTAFGYNAGVVNTGVSCTAFGFESLKANTTGTSITTFGYRAGLVANGANNLTAIGREAGIACTTGTENTLIGSQTGANLTTGSASILIGYAANMTTETNAIVIGYNLGTTGSNYVDIGKAGNKITCKFDTNATWSQASDVRLKQNIQDAKLGLSFINRLRPVTFQWKPSNELDPLNPEYTEVNNKNTSITLDGLIAQEVKAAMDAELNDTFLGWETYPNGIQSISREMFITPMIKAIQELKAEFDAYKATHP